MPKAQQCSIKVSIQNLILKRKLFQKPYKLLYLKYQPSFTKYKIKNISFL